jgi:hyperosmotically inducible protein
MFRRFGTLLPAVALTVLLLGLAEVSMATARSASNQQFKGLADKVRHELVMLPFYGVFDNLSFSIEGADTVVLTGQVTRPILKSESESAVRRVEGVAKVVNNIEVLPLSPMDDSIRLATYRAIFSRPGFEKYAIQAVSPIRIIVKHGNITLDGVVASQLDKTLAEMAARSVPLTFGVTNNLTVGS